MRVFNVPSVEMQRLLLILLMASIFLFAWKLQSALFLNYDVSWLMHASERLLAGGTYSRDFFETNPPLILYLYLPPVIFSKIFAFNLVLLFRAGCFSARQNKLRSKAESAKNGA